MKFRWRDFPALLLSATVALLIFSCAPKREVAAPKVPVYRVPVKGKLIVSGRGFFIRTECGSYIRTVAPGKVVYSGRDIGSYGWVVIVRQEDGYTSVYGGLARSWVRSGERVKIRQVIGEAGKMRGNCGVYYELRNALGDPVAPVLR